MLLLTNSLFYIADDVDSGDLDIERAIVRSELTCDTRVPDPVGAVYDLNDDGSVPGISIFCLGKQFSRKKNSTKKSNMVWKDCVCRSYKWYCIPLTNTIQNIKDMSVAP